MNDRDEALIGSIAVSPMAMVITDMRIPDYPIIAVNRAFCELTGYEEQEALGRNCRFLAGPATSREGSAALGEAVRTARPALVELLNYKKNGTEFRNAVMIAPTFDGDGKLLHYIGSQMDVTDSRSLPSMLRRQRAESMVNTLSQRQRQVLHEMMLGYRNKQIASRLGISEKTVKMHRAALLTKLEVPTSADAVRIAVEAAL